MLLHTINILNMGNRFEDSKIFPYLLIIAFVIWFIVNLIKLFPIIISIAVAIFLALLIVALAGGNED